MTLQLIEAEKPVADAQLTQHTTAMWGPLVMLATAKGVRAYALAVLDEGGSGAWYMDAAVGEARTKLLLQVVQKLEHELQVSLKAIQKLPRQAKELLDAD
jgi:hypothetical protein